MKRRRSKIKVKKGALHQQLGIPEKEPIPITRLRELNKSKSGKTRKRANFALNARNWDRRARRRKMSKTEMSVWKALTK